MMSRQTEDHRASRSGGGKRQGSNRASFRIPGSVHKICMRDNEAPNPLDIRFRLMPRTSSETASGNTPAQVLKRSKGELRGKPLRHRERL